MAAIGRLNIATSLKQLLELSGPYQPAIGEGIVPTIQLANTEDTPFSATPRWQAGWILVATAAQYNWFMIAAADSLPEHSFVVVDRVHVAGGFSSANGFQIAIGRRGLFPAGLTFRGIPRLMSQGGDQAPDLQGAGNVDVYAGPDVAGPGATALPMFSSPNGQPSLRIDGPWFLGTGAALAVAAYGVNVDMRCAAFGRVFLTGKR